MIKTVYRAINSTMHSVSSPTKQAFPCSLVLLVHEAGPENGMIILLAIEIQLSCTPSQQSSHCLMLLMTTHLNR